MNKPNCEIKENLGKGNLYDLFNDNAKIARDEINSLQTYFRTIHIRIQLDPVK